MRENNMGEITILGAIGFGILVVTAFISGYITGKTEMRTLYKVIIKDLTTEAFSIGVKESASAIDSMLVKLQSREKISLPSYKLTWSGMTIKMIEEVERKNVKKTMGDEINIEILKEIHKEN